MLRIVLLTGQNSPLFIVISTLLIAGLFTPLRGRLQDFFGQRFYRRKYDAEKTLAQFTISARDEVDLGELTAELLNMVDQTMRPVKLRFCSERQAAFARPYPITLGWD